MKGKLEGYGRGVEVVIDIGGCEMEPGVYFFGGSVVEAVIRVVEVTEVSNVQKDK